MNRKIVNICISILLVISMVVSLAGCGKDKAKDPSETETESADVVSTTDPENSEIESEDETDPDETDEDEATTADSASASTPSATGTGKTSTGSSSSGSTSTSANSANWGSPYVGTAEQDSQARVIAKQIANSIGPGTDLERVRQAAEKVNEYYRKCVHVEKGANYATAYGVFIAKEASCYGTTSALGMVLEYMGYSWTRCKADPSSGSKHQWCQLTMDNRIGYADGQLGIAEYGLSTCNHTHSFTDTVIKEATCTEPGKMLSTCHKDGCGYQEEQILFRLDHDYQQKAIDPTCTEEGYTKRTCSRCGDNYEFNYVSKLGHDYISTETEDGHTLYTCSRCGDSYKD